MKRPISIYLLEQPLTLTFDVQSDPIGRSLSLDVLGGARVEAGVSPSDVLDDQGPVGHDHSLVDVVGEEAVLRKGRVKDE